MTIKASVFIATSLDGFISRTDGSIDWLEKANATVPEGEDCGYLEFINSVDVLVMGRNSFEKVLSFGMWPYEDKRVVVLSIKSIELSADLQATVSCSSENPADLVKRLADEGVRHLYIDGGVTIQNFLAEGLIDELTITLIPVLLGEGKPLFGPLERDLMLVHIGTRAYDFGFVQLKYQVVTGS